MKRAKPGVAKFNPWAADATEAAAEAAKPASPHKRTQQAVDEHFDEDAPPPSVDVRYDPYGGFIAQMDSTAGLALARLLRALRNDVSGKEILRGYGVSIAAARERPSGGYFVYDADIRYALTVDGVDTLRDAMIQVIQALLACDRIPHLRAVLETCGIRPYRL